MLKLIRLPGLMILIAALWPMGSLAEPSARDFVRLQASKAAFIAEVGKIDFMAGEMFRFGTYAVMRMTHEHWEFAEDAQLLEHGQTYSYEVKSTADRTVYDARQAAATIARNNSVGEEIKIVAHGMIDDLDELRLLSLELAELYDTGDVRLAGDHYYGKIVPVYEAIRRGEATVASELAREIRLDAAAF